MTAGRRSADRQTIWSAIRMLRRCCVADVMEIAEVPRQTVARFMCDLARHGFLRAETRGQRGIYYWLACDPGPFAPRAGKSRVFDPNDALRHETARRTKLQAELRATENRIAKLRQFAQGVRHAA